MTNPQDETTEDTTPVTQDPALLDRIHALEKQLSESQEIAKRAQSDYLRLKRDMDAHIERTQQAQRQMSEDTLITVAQKMLPGILQLEQTTLHIPEESKASWRSQGVLLSYQKIIAELALLGIEEHIPEIGWDLDLMFEIPLWTQPVDDAALKTKVSAVAQNWFVYTKADPQRIILPAKVFIGE